MSRPPFRPGGEIPGWGGWTPANLRVHGVVPGSAQAQALMGRFGASMRQFYLSQAHNAEISGLAHWAKTIDHGDHRISYVRQFGLETVTLVPSFAALAKAEEEARKEEPWDFCVVDFVSPLQFRSYVSESIGDVWLGTFSDIYVRCSQVETQRGEHWALEYGAASLNRAIADWVSAEGLVPGGGPVGPTYPDITSGTPRVAWYTGLDTVTLYTGPENVAKGSVKLDLRTFHTYEEVEYEVYANLQNPWPNDFVTDEDTILDWVAYPDDFPGGAALTGLLGPSDLPPAGYDGMTYSGDIPGGVAYNAFLQFRLNPGGPPYTYETETSAPPTWWVPSTEYDQYTLGDEITLATSETRFMTFDVAPDETSTANATWLLTAAGTARPVLGVDRVPVTVESTMTMTAAMFRGGRFEERDFDVPSDPGEFAYGEWWIANQASRFELGEIGAVPVDAVQLEYEIPDGETVYYQQYVQANGRPYIGKIIVSPKHGTVRFDPA